MKKDTIGDISLYLYEKYGIADWNKKKLLLDDSEIHNLMLDLENKVESELVKTIKLPFPKFTSQYLSKFEDPENLTKTNGYEYVLFMLTDNQIKAVVQSIKGEETLTKASQDLSLKNYYDVIYNIITTPFNKFNPIINITVTNWTVKSKYIYLLQFIDQQEAERLNLTNHTFYAMEQYRGFELEEKLSLLNDAIKECVKTNIGLDNFDLHLDRETTAKTCNLPKATVNRVLEIVIPLLLKSYGEMANALGYLGTKSENGINEYSKENYRKLDIILETEYIKRNKLSETEKTVLSERSKKEALLYIAAKYMYLNKESLAKNMGLSIQAADEQIMKLK